jgi:hypothetical protein
MVMASRTNADNRNPAESGPWQAASSGYCQTLDARLLDQLPHSDGYEWMQAGVDLILVTVAPGEIHELLKGAFD